MKNRERIHAPNWLGEIAKKKYGELVKSYPPLDVTQLDLVAMMAECYETYLQATKELAQHCQNTGTLSTTGSTGQQTQHPGFKTQCQAIANYTKLAQQLRVSLGKEPPAPIQDTSLDDLVGLN